MAKLKIWLDCDPGIDDAAALAVAAAARDRLELLGVSVTAGNQTLAKVADNCRRLMAYLALCDSPLLAISPEPLLRAPKTAGAIHGETGLGRERLPDTDFKPRPGNGLLQMRNLILALPPAEQVTVVALGPLSNIALLLKAFPEVREKIARIVLMGGAAEGGNETPFAEFNFWADPEAAAIVMQDGLPVVMAGLDVTHQCGLSRAEVAALETAPGEKTRTFGRMLRFYFETVYYRTKEKIHIHDAVTLLYLLYPELFTGEQVSVRLDCTDGVERGRSHCCPDANGSVFLLRTADSPALAKTLTDLLNSLK